MAAQKKPAARKPAAEKPAPKADTAVKPMNTEDVEQPQSYRVDRGESIPGPEPKDGKDAKDK